MSSFHLPNLWFDLSPSYLFIVQTEGMGRMLRVLRKNPNSQMIRNSLLKQSICLVAGQKHFLFFQLHNLGP